MKLSQKRPYRSIIQLPDTDLPLLTVLTGINGSGKTHLLEAIRLGSVACDLVKDANKEIGSYSWHNLVPNDVGVTTIAQVYQHRDWFLDQVRNRRAQRKQDLLNVLATFGAETKYSNDPWVALSDPESMLEEVLGSKDRAAELRRQLDGFESDIESTISNGIGEDYTKRSIFRYLISSGKKFHSLLSSDFDDRTFTSSSQNMFQHSFGEMFFSYFQKLKNNYVRIVAEQRGHATKTSPLSEEEFVQQNGRPPWDFVNETLRRAGLDFEIDHPDDFEATQYLPKLTKISSGVAVDFSALSSGEKVLMSFAFCLYYSADKRQDVDRPKLLLLDEIDAPLHPSMSRVLIEIVNDVLVKEEGLSVIFVTHSPSTVAVSPDDSVHLLAAATNIISKESKRRAIATLTAEIPTLSIDYSGRRQVFVESGTDADRYSRLYQILAPRMATERSLAFIGVGHRSNKAETNAGCDQVVSTVKALAREGNISVLGLIDWDKSNDGDARVLVLGKGARYAIENFLLDPLLIAACLVSIGKHVGTLSTLTKADTFVRFPEIDHQRLQGAVDEIQRKVLAKLGVVDPPTTVAGRYLGGLTMELDERYLHYQGHKLEAAVQEVFPALKAFHQPNLLMLDIIDSVLLNHPDLCPVELLTAMEDLCATEVS